MKPGGSVVGTVCTLAGPTTSKARSTAGAEVIFRKEAIKSIPPVSSVSMNGLFVVRAGPNSPWRLNRTPDKKRGMNDLQMKASFCDIGYVFKKTSLPRLGEITENSTLKTAIKNIGSPVPMAASRG